MVAGFTDPAPDSPPRAPPGRRVPPRSPRADNAGKLKDIAHGSVLYPSPGEHEHITSRPLVLSHRQMLWAGSLLPVCRRLTSPDPADEIHHARASTHFSNSGLDLSSMMRAMSRHLINRVADACRRCGAPYLLLDELHPGDRNHLLETLLCESCHEAGRFGVVGPGPIPNLGQLAEVLPGRHRDLFSFPYRKPGALHHVEMDQAIDDVVVSTQQRLAKYRPPYERVSPLHVGVQGPEKRYLHLAVFSESVVVQACVGCRHLLIDPRGKRPPH